MYNDTLCAHTYAQLFSAMNVSVINVIIRDSPIVVINGQTPLSHPVRSSDISGTFREIYMQRGHNAENNIARISLHSLRLLNEIFTVLLQCDEIFSFALSSSGGNICFNSFANSLQQEYFISVT